MYEIFEHTADLGIRIRSYCLNSLFEEAGKALFSLMVENLDDVRSTQQFHIQISQDNKELLLFDWLNELLYIADARQLLASRFTVHIQGNTLNAEVYGEPKDEQRHQLDHEVKAITYHQLKLEQQPDGQWLAEVIVDI